MMNGDTPTNDADTADNHIDERCDAFESAWREGQRPHISDFLSSERSAVRAKLFRELLLVELECRRLIGDSPTQKDYLVKFPEFASQIEAIRLQYGDAAFAATAAHRESTYPDEALRAGGHIAHFELVAPLGTGAMGEAWKAWDSRLRRHVTLKLPRGLSMAENDLRRFLREGQSGAQLHHSQLASVHDVGRDGEIYYLVATYVEGQNLRDFVRQRPLTFQAIATLCAEIAEALHHVHVKGLIHRDLKPANIIVDPSGRPNIIDFGLAKWLDDDSDLTMQGELVGTLAYMSPEQAGGDTAQVSDKSDIYSLGVILFELLTGSCPFDGHRDAVIRQILVREPARPRSLRRTIPRDLETICLKAIEKNPTRRYSRANDLAADLRSFASGKPIRARRPRMPEKCIRLISRRPAAVAILAAAIAVVAASGMAVTSLRKQNRRLEGYRPVYVTSIPSGARIALVPIDPSTNELSVAPEKIIRPPGYTPLMTEAKSGRYFVEAVLPNSEGPIFAEVYRTVDDISRLSESSAMANSETGLDPATCRFPSIVLKPLAEATTQMVKIRIDDQSRRLNPLLPQFLYVDARQTSPTDRNSPNQNIGHLLSTTALGEPCITYQAAVEWAELNQKRLASSAEYDAIVKALEIRAESQTIDDLFDERPEYTTTIKVDPSAAGNAATNHLHEMHVLKGYGDSTSLSEMVTWSDGSLLSPHNLKSAMISIRGVHSGTPRFVNPQ